jgi:hypothetical protein
VYLDERGVSYRVLLGRHRWKSRRSGTAEGDSDSMRELISPVRFTDLQKRSYDVELLSPSCFTGSSEHKRPER